MKLALFLLSFCFLHCVISPVYATEMLTRGAEERIFGYDEHHRPVVVRVVHPDAMEEALTDDEQRGIFKYDGEVTEKSSPRKVSVEEALQEVQTKLAQFRGIPSLTVSLRDNGLTDVGFQTLCTFVLGHPDIKDHLVSLDLYNNRITAASVSNLKNLLEQIKGLHVKLSANELRDGDLTALTVEDRERVTCSPF